MDELMEPSCPAASHASSTVLRSALRFFLRNRRTNSDLLGLSAIAVAMILPR
jgi:hypothetical protein